MAANANAGDDGVDFFSSFVPLALDGQSPQMKT
jgi:hypothetical protein